MTSCTNSQPKKREQYGSSTGCKYIVQLQRLISLKQVTRLLKKEQWVYKLRNSSDLKYLPVLVLFLMEHHRKKTSIFAVIQHATDPKEQSSRQFVSFFSIGINACVYFFYARTIYEQNSVSHLPKGTYSTAFGLFELLLMATEKEVSSENYRILPGYYLWSPGTARE